MNFERLDAALEFGRNTVFFFSGSQYVRFNMRTGRVDEGYPDSIRKRWVGVTFDRIDAAIHWGNGKVYFFKDDQQIRYDMTTYKADPSYPKQIPPNYVDDWTSFD